MVGAAILKQFQLETQDRAVFLGGEFEVIHVAAPVNRRLEVFTARFDPFHGPTDHSCYKTHERFFGVNVELATEAAADFGRYYTQPVLREPQHSGNKRTHQMWNLRRGINGQ